MPRKKNGPVHKPFTPKELTSSLGELGPAMVRDPRDEPLGRRPLRLQAKRLPMPALSPRILGITLLSGGMLYTLAGMAPAGAGGLFGNPAFPRTGEFRIRPDHADAPLGKLSVAADERNLVVQLHDDGGEPVFMGFVRAGSRALLQVPAGSWKSLIVPADAWSGGPVLVSAKQFSSMGVIEIAKGKQINITADDMNRIADRGR
jgi:hypothetical protein